MFTKIFAALLYVIFFMYKRRQDPNTEVNRAWPRNANRDTKAYVLPDKNTTIHEPKDVCTNTEYIKEKLFVLVVVFSKTNSFDNRAVIRETWGSYPSYKTLSKSVHEYRKKKGQQVYKIYNDVNNTLPDFKLVFLVGLPDKKNKLDIQKNIDEEAAKYEDILQEHFIDSYHNLTIKSVMMLKWLRNKCIDYVTYILKTDDDVYVNLPFYIQFLSKNSYEFEKEVENGFQEKQYEIIGLVDCENRRLSNPANKWYSPEYMYEKSQYPCFAVGGSGYALAYPVVDLLYEAALRTPVFHIEDIYITGLCREASTIPITLVSTKGELNFGPDCKTLPQCSIFAKTICHDLDRYFMTYIHDNLLMPGSFEMCDGLKTRRELRKILMKEEVYEGEKENTLL